MAPKTFVLAMVVAVVLAAPGRLAAAPFILPSASDTILSSAFDDAAFGPIALGFSFSFFGGAPVNSVFFSTNGNLTFGAGDSTFVNFAFPGGQARIAPFFNDLVAPPGNVRVNALTPGVFVSIWNGNGFFGSAGQVTAEAVLFGPGNPYGQAPGTIALSYGTVTGADTTWGTGATVGLNSGLGTAVTLASLGLGSAGGIFTPAQATTLSDRTFCFTPTGSTYSVGECAPQLVPEPTTLALTLLGGISALAAARRRRAAKN
jgi:hypothetical protein